MLALYFILFGLNWAPSQTLNPLHESLFNNENYLSNNETDANIFQHQKILENHSKTALQFDTFVPILLNMSVEILQSVENNIKNNYDLSDDEVKLITPAFELSKLEYHLLLKNNLEKLKSIEYSSEDIFLLDFTDFSNFLMQSIIQNNLNKLKGKLDMPSKWYNHLLKYTILRQQMKIAVNLVEIKICLQLSICVKKQKYTEYLVEWLRLLLNVDAPKLKKFFFDISELLIQYMHSIRTNQKFREKAKALVEFDPTYQRNLLDYIDEIIIEQKTVNVVEQHLIKFVILLRNLFQIIDENYDLNHVNEWKMNKLLQMFFQWTKHQDLELKDILFGIVENMQQNVQIWPRDVKSKLDDIWSKIIQL